MRGAGRSSRIRGDQSQRIRRADEAARRATHAVERSGQPGDFALHLQALSWTNAHAVAAAGAACFVQLR